MGAGAARLGVKYEDVRFQPEQWAKEYKPGKLVINIEHFESAYFLKAMPFGRVPVLEVDGTKIAGGINILRFLGKRFGKYETCYSIVEQSRDNLSVGE